MVKAHDGKVLSYSSYVVKQFKECQNWAIENGNYTVILELIKSGIVNATSETKVCRSTHYKSEWCEDLITWATKRRLSGIFLIILLFCICSHIYNMNLYLSCF